MTALLPLQTGVTLGTEKSLDTMAVATPDYRRPLFDLLQCYKQLQTPMMIFRDHPEPPGLESRGTLWHTHPYPWPVTSA